MPHQELDGPKITGGADLSGVIRILAGTLTTSAGVVVDLSGSTVILPANVVGLQNPMTAAGDMIVGGVNGAPLRLPIGQPGQVLSVSQGGSLIYATLTAGSATPTGGSATPAPILLSGNGGDPLPGTIVATAPYDSSYAASHAFDGDNSSQWAGAQTTGQYIGMTFAGVQTFTKLDIFPRFNYGGEIQGQAVQTTQDGATWLTVGTTPSSIPNDVFTSAILPDNSTGRGIRILGGDGSRTSLQELRIYGIPTADPIAAANPSNRFKGSTSGVASGANLAMWPDQITGGIALMPLSGAATRQGNAVQFSGGGRYAAAGFARARPSTTFIAFKSDGAACNPFCYNDGYVGGMRFEVFPNGSGAVTIPNFGQFAFAGNVLTGNAWHTVSMVQPSGGGEMILYIDGVLSGWTGGAAVTQDFDTLGIGGSGYSQFTGLIGEVALFPIVITAQQAAAFHAYINSGSIYS